jgi:hypothetical protein
MNKYSVNKHTSKDAASTLEKLASHGAKFESITCIGGKIYLGDGNDYKMPDGSISMPREQELIDVHAAMKAQVFGASGKIDEANKLKVFTDLYHTYDEVYQKVREAQKDAWIPWHHIVGAAGPEAVTAYQTIRRSKDLLDVVLGQRYVNEDYLAINIAELVERPKSVKIEYLKRTSALITVQQRLADTQTPDPQRDAFAKEEREIFADGIQHEVSMRDTIDTLTDINAEFLKQLPGAFLASKNAKVVALLNAITGNNQGDWDAATGNFFDVNAADQVQTAENAVKKYGAERIAIMPHDTWALYMKNQQGIVHSSEPNRVKSTVEPGAKSGRLIGNPGVTYYIDDALTSQSYVLAAKESYMKFLQGMILQTSVVDKTTPGQTERRFWFDFNEAEESLSAAQYKGTTVGA